MRFCAHNEEGFTLIEMMFSLVIMALIIPGIVLWMEMGKEETKKKVAAGQISSIGQALSEYTLDNYGSLLGSTTNITIDDLSTNGYLPSDWDNSLKNPWGQSYDLYVMNPSSQNLQALVMTTGGTISAAKFQNEVIPSASTMIGAKGGFFPTGNIPGESASTIQGAYGTWELSSPPANPGPGHLAWFQYFNEGSFGEDYLYRVGVPGHPELNRMSVNLDMDGNDITMGGGDILTESGNIDTDGGELTMGGGDILTESGNINTDGGEIDTVGGNIMTQGGDLMLDDGSVQDASRVVFTDQNYSCAAGDNGQLFFSNSDGLYLCRSGEKLRIADKGNEGYFQYANVVSHGDTIPKPECINSNPKIYLAPASFSNDDTGEYIKGVQAYAVDSGSSWTARLKVLSSSGWMNPGPSYGKMIAISKCVE